MTIIEKKELHLHNLISIRRRMNQKELAEEVQNMKAMITDSGVTAGDLVTATFAAENNEKGEVIMDVEILCPVEKEISVMQPYVLKKELYITNALMSEFSGPASGISSVYNEINKYIMEHMLQPVTAAYTVNKGIANEGNKADIAVYVGINPNIL